MRRLAQLLADLKNKDRGSLALIAASLVLLMGMAAFGTDLAWFYLNSARIQRAADAASLGGVIHLPADEPSAVSNAHQVAIQNGYDDANAETVVLPTRVATNKLKVEISHDVPTFFLKVFGMQTLSLIHI